MTTVTATTGTTSTTSTTASSQAATGSIMSDFQTFLTLMTTQAQYQDPLEPMDASDFTAQLAQFSGVEQQVLTNTYLEDILSQFSDSSVTDLASWLGKDVLAETSGHYDGTNPVTVHTEVASAADSAQLVVYNEDGTEVGRVGISTSAEEVTWEGDDGDGGNLSVGSYTFKVESLDADGDVIETNNASVYSQVVETQNDDGTLKLVLDNGTTVLPSAVTALRMTT